MCLTMSKFQVKNGQVHIEFLVVHTETMSRNGLVSVCSTEVTYQSYINLLSQSFAQK